MLEISLFRLFALLMTFVLGYYLLRLVHKNRISGQEFFLWFSLVIFVSILSVYPQVIKTLFTVFSLSQDNRYDRLAGLAFIFILICFVMIFYYRNLTQEHRENFLRYVQNMSLEQFFKEHLADIGKHTTLIIIPAYNEEQNIASILEKVPLEICGTNVQTVVVADGCTDETVREALKHNAWVVKHGINFGQGMALATGYRCAIKLNAKYIATLDADGQYQPEEIERLIEPLVNNEADIVSGSRMIGFYEQKYSNNHFIRSFGVQFFNIILTFLTGKKITDSSSGFRAIKVEYLRKLNFFQEQFHSTEFLIECLKNGLHFKEVPISFLKRISGESKKPRALKYGLGFTKAILSTWLRK
jgi:hypothetical protein